MGRKKSSIPGFSFSAQRALGISQAKQKFARQTGIPTTKSGLYRKIGKTTLQTGSGCVVVFISLILILFAFSSPNLEAASAKTSSVETSTKSTKKSDALTYRLSKTGKRHNSKCRYYYSKGRSCSKDEGVACKVCGG